MILGAFWKDPFPDRAGMRVFISSKSDLEMGASGEQIGKKLGKWLGKSQEVGK
jgi:hypothetical protein